MAETIDYEKLLTIFDSLVANGVIKYSLAETVRLEDAGFAFEYYISQSLVGKPQAGQQLLGASGASEHAVYTRPPCFGPGSDIAYEHPDLLIDTVKETHLLVLSKFPVFRPHMLLLTGDSYRRQHEPLALMDVEAAWAVLKKLETPHYAMYNCTTVAGSSREHKHLQIVPLPNAKDGFCFFPDGNVQRRVPFRYHLRYFRDWSDEQLANAENVFSVYKELLMQTKETLRQSAEDPVCPHNVVLTTRWIISIPRSNDKYHGATANAAGMMGSVWLMRESQLEHIRNIGPSKVLAHLGIAALEK